MATYGKLNWVLGCIPPEACGQASCAARTLYVMEGKTICASMILGSRCSPQRILQGLPGATRPGMMRSLVPAYLCMPPSKTGHGYLQDKDGARYIYEEARRMKCRAMHAWMRYAVWPSHCLTLPEAGSSRYAGIASVHASRG